MHDFYHALANVQVFTVQESSVTHKYTLGGVTRIHTRPVGIEKNKEALNILIGKQCPSAKRDLYVCKELCLAFSATGISAATFLTIMTLEISILDELYGPPKELDLPGTKSTVPIGLAPHGLVCGIDGLSSRNAFVFGLPTPVTETPTTPPNEWLSFTHRTPPSVPRSQSMQVNSQSGSPAHGLSPGMLIYTFIRLYKSSSQNLGHIQDTSTHHLVPSLHGRPWIQDCKRRNKDWLELKARSL